MSESPILTYHISFKQKMELLGAYAKKRLMAQVRSVALIVLYLICFQTLVLKIPIVQASEIAAGIAVVIIGLAFFMEGLFWGLMPLGEIIGVKLPQKTRLPVILAFAFLVGVGATFAEPAIGILKDAGRFVLAWEAPLLYLLLNKQADLLVNAIGIGVGIAVMAGVLRFSYGWSLKPFVYVLTGLLCIFTLWAFFDPNLRFLTGLAWDCGAVTTGPVTVPLVLALGVGICRIVSGGSSEGAGFGVVTLASLFPILSVLLLGVFFLPQAPAPMTASEFFAEENQTKHLNLFHDKNEMIGYALRHAPPDAQLALFQYAPENMREFLLRLKADENLRKSVFHRGDLAFLEAWAVEKGTEHQRRAIFSDSFALESAMDRYTGVRPPGPPFSEILWRNFKAAARAIIPLAAFFILVLFLILKDRLPRADEIFLGILLAVAGMGLFNVGIEIGLSRLGAGVGATLPASFTKIQFPENKKPITNFDRSLVHTALSPDGQREDFFYTRMDDVLVQAPFHAEAYDASRKIYVYTPEKGPLFGGGKGISGFLVVLFFAFVMGYGATLAEPALNALGVTVEELTVGTFQKSLLIHAVAAGVGLGMALGVAKILWDLPLAFLLIPPYVALLILTALSSEDFVNIAWDSAGVTTGPITVPLVLAIGLGIGNQVRVIEGFGILAMASVCPILTVLVLGLYVDARRKAIRREIGA